jgi:hypothetical protein
MKLVNVVYYRKQGSNNVVIFQAEVVQCDFLSKHKFLVRPDLLHLLDVFVHYKKLIKVNKRLSLNSLPHFYYVTLRMLQFVVVPHQLALDLF